MAKGEGWCAHRRSRMDTRRQTRARSRMDGFNRARGYKTSPHTRRFPTVEGENESGYDSVQRTDNI
jgi:hypothetical protein